MQIINNAVIGVYMSPNAPVATNEYSSAQRVGNYAGIRADSIPARMLGNVVAGSNDIGSHKGPNAPLPYHFCACRVQGGMFTMSPSLKIEPVQGWGPLCNCRSCK